MADLTGRSWDTHASAFRREAVRVGLLSVVLAVLLELLQIVVTVAVGADYGPSKVARDTLLKLPWTVIVCVSLWAAITLGADRTKLIAIVGLLAAPIASLVARSVAELAHAFTAAAAPAAAPAPLLVAALRGLEYAVLALVVLWLRRRVRSAALHHAAAGLLVGLLFGSALLILIVRFASEPVTIGTLMAWTINELLFPVGCALILSRAEQV